MSRLYLDTEFNGHGGRLISMALVTEDDCRDFYEVAPIGNLDPWVAEHVIPALHKREIPMASFRKLFHNFILGFSNPEIICDWHADAAHFCDMLAGPDYGTSLDFACRITIVKRPPAADGYCSAIRDRVYYRLHERAQYTKAKRPRQPSRAAGPSHREASAKPKPVDRPGLPQDGAEGRRGTPKVRRIACGPDAIRLAGQAV